MDYAVVCNHKGCFSVKLISAPAEFLTKSRVKVTALQAEQWQGMAGLLNPDPVSLTDGHHVPTIYGEKHWALSILCWSQLDD